MKDTKIKCMCGCGKTLYVCDNKDGEVVVGSEDSAKKGFRIFKGVIVNKKDLIKLLKS